MKLVDILARELKVWPEGVRVITQQQSGYLFDEANYPLDILVSESEDWFSATVPSAQWQSAVDALKAEKVVELFGEFANLNEIRTPEQIAAEEREKAIDGMISVVNAGFFDNTRAIYGALYDAGFRKFEIVDN